MLPHLLARTSDGSNQAKGRSWFRGTCLTQEAKAVLGRGTEQAPQAAGAFALAGVTNFDLASHYLSEVCMPAFNAEFAQSAREPGSTFVPCRDLAVPDSIPWKFHERTVWRDKIRATRFAMLF